jgi:ABC-2 type transport system permease protein
MTAAFQVLRRSALISVADFFALYPLREYVTAWLPRGLFQLAFFALVAQFIGGSQFAAFALVGTAAQVTYQSVFTTVTSSVIREQGVGTVPLLVAAPMNPLLVFTARNAAMAGHGVLSGMLPLVVALTFIGIPFDPIRIVGSILVLGVVALGAYGFGVLLGSAALWWRGYHNVLSSFAGTIVTILCGAYIPRQTLPDWAHALGETLPVTHGLEAMRMTLAGSFDRVGPEVALELVIAVGSLVIAQLAVRRFLVRARRSGTLDFH